MAKHMSVGIPAKDNVRTYARKNPEHMPDRTPNSMSKYNSGRMPEKMPDRMSEHIGHRMPERMSQYIPGYQIECQKK